MRNTPSYKKKFKQTYKGVKGSVVAIYSDWQECTIKEGEAELLEFHRHFGSFQLPKIGTFVGERWKVRFKNSNFVTHRYIRVKYYTIKEK